MSLCLEYVHSSMDVYLNNIDFRSIPDKTVYYLSLFISNSAFEGIKIIKELRCNNNLNPLLLFSFYSKLYLSKYPDYNIINLPGIYFLELPSSKQNLLNLIYSVVPISDFELQTSIKYLYSGVGKATFFLKSLKIEDVEKINNLDKFLINNYGVGLPEDRYKDLDDLKGSLYELLPRYEIMKLLNKFTHGNNLDLINKSFGPLLALYKAYFSGSVKYDICYKAVKDFLSNKKMLILKDNLNAFFKNINLVTSINEFNLATHFPKNSDIVDSVFPDYNKLNIPFHNECLNYLLDYFEILQNFTEFSYKEYDN